MLALFHLVWSACVILLLLLSSLAATAGELEPIGIGPDGKSFVLAASGKEFRVWGVNYDHDSYGKNGRLLEDYWETEWETVRSDFQEIKELGANVVRVHLQLGKFMAAADTPNRQALAKLTDLLRLAEEVGLYLDITGLGSYHKAETPAWYDALNETMRWKVQATFWSAIARTCRNSPAVFCYDLMNEPVVDGKKEEGWVAGELGGKSYVQRLTLEKGDRTAIQIAKAWVDQLTAAIRAEDPDHLITVGVIPWAMVWPNAKDVFYSPEVSGAFDFVSIHVYPKSGEIEKALAALKVYEIGKPLVIEETFPLSCSLEEMEEFLKQSRRRTAGYVSFYWGRTIEEYAQAPSDDIGAAITREWLKYFKRHAETMKRAH
ncbi:MAG: cellulase family glycosylhydrolase [Limisphaerales bacterium]